MAPTALKVDPSHDGWWKDWFNSVYLDVYSHRDDRQAAQEIETTTSILPVFPYHHILDLCCGNGRHVRALQKAGFKRVVGVDFSYPLLKSAQSLSKGNYVRGDMRLLSFAPRSFYAVLSYFTSFGYFKTNVENLRVLHEISRILQPGGWFLLDYLNPNHVRRNYVPETVKQHGEYAIREVRSFSKDGERIEKEIIIQNWGDREHRFRESVRLYDYKELMEMLRSADLHIVGALGSFDGESYNPDSPRMILYGSRR